jgi:hypothetical protein
MEKQKEYNLRYLLAKVYLRIVVFAVLCSWSGRPDGPTTNTARLSPRYEGKTRGCYCNH